MDFIRPRYLRVMDDRILRSTRDERIIEEEDVFSTTAVASVETTAEKKKKEREPIGRDDRVQVEMREKSYF